MSSNSLPRDANRGNGETTSGSTAGRSKFRKVLALQDWYKAEAKPLSNALWRALEARWFVDQGRNDESWLPCPVINFMCNVNDKLVCQICRETALRVHEDGRDGRADASDDSLPLIMPCGHVAGAACLSRWLQDRDSCPFCRVKLRYSRCGHPVQVRPVTRSSLHNMPPTLPVGGGIPPVCRKCYDDKIEADTLRELGRLTGEFRGLAWRVDFQVDNGLPLEQSPKGLADPDPSVRRLRGEAGRLDEIKQQLETAVREMHVRMFVYAQENW